VLGRGARGDDGCKSSFGDDVVPVRVRVEAIVEVVLVVKMVTQV
jgi:hypothetical protein